MPTPEGIPLGVNPVHIGEIMDLKRPLIYAYPENPALSWP